MVLKISSQTFFKILQASKEKLCLIFRLKFFLCISVVLITRCFLSTKEYHVDMNESHAESKYTFFALKMTFTSMYIDKIWYMGMTDSVPMCSCISSFVRMIPWSISWRTTGSVCRRNTNLIALNHWMCGSLYSYRAAILVLQLLIFWFPCQMAQPPFKLYCLLLISHV